MSASSSLPIGRFIRRDPRVWVSVVSLVVAWGIALLNMAGFTVKRGGTAAEASDWKTMLGFAVVLSAVLIPLMVARALLWKKVVPTTATVDTAKAKTGGMYFTYRYEFGGSSHAGKFSVVPNSPLFLTRPGDQITVYVHPQKPQKSIMAL